MVPFIAESSHSPFSVRRQKWLSPLIDCHLLGNSWKQMETAVDFECFNYRRLTQPWRTRKELSKGPRRGKRHPMKGGNIDAWLTLKAKTYESGHCEDCFKKTCHTKKMSGKISNSPSLRSLAFLFKVPNTCVVCLRTTTMFPPTSAPIHHPSPWSLTDLWDSERICPRCVWCFSQKAKRYWNLAANVMVTQISPAKLQSAPSLAYQESPVEWVEFRWSIVHCINSTIFSICFEAAHLFVPIVDGHMLACQDSASLFFQSFSAILSISLISQNLPVSSFLL